MAKVVVSTLRPRPVTVISGVRDARFAPRRDESFAITRRSDDAGASRRDPLDRRDSNRNVAIRVVQPPHVPREFVDKTVVGDVVMGLREDGDFVLFKQGADKLRVYLRPEELDDLAVALDQMLGRRRSAVR